jgi:hypothetical protein
MYWMFLYKDTIQVSSVYVTRLSNHEWNRLFISKAQYEYSAACVEE